MCYWFMFLFKIQIDEPNIYCHTHILLLALLGCYIFVIYQELTDEQAEDNSSHGIC